MKKNKLTFSLIVVLIINIFLFLMFFKINSHQAKSREIITFEPHDYSKDPKPTLPSPTPVIYKPETNEVKTYNVSDSSYPYRYSVVVPSDWTQSTFGGEADGTNFNMNYYYDNPYCNLRIYVLHSENANARNVDFSDWNPKTFTNQNGIKFTRTTKGTSYAWTMPPHPNFWIANDIECENSEEIYDQFLDNFNIIDK